MARTRKEPKPYTLKQRRGERPYRYSEQYYGCLKDPADERARTAWMVRFSPARRGDRRLERRGA